MVASSQAAGPTACIVAATAAAGLGLAAALYMRRRLRGQGLVYLRGQGLAVGELTDGVVRFVGLPFAKAERWKPPRAAPSWWRPRRNPATLHRAPQPGKAGEWNKPLTVFGQYAVEDSEEACLEVNVWAPAAALAGDGQPRPIVFYIHGGAGKLMSAHDDDYSGQKLAATHGCVYVACNYRLGALGFLAHPALSDEDEAAAPGAERGVGCYAVLDQLAALRWVRQHGSSFGGDVDNVTIWGLSSGAQYVATLLVSPPAAGLFHRAMIQSCVDLSNVRELRARHDVWQQTTAEEWGRRLARELGCADDSPREELGKMRSVATEAIIDKSWCVAATDCYEPLVDRRQLVMPATKPLTSLEALRSGHFHRVPVMLGVTSEDGLGKTELEWTMFADGTTLEQYRALLGQKFGGGARLAAALAHYPAQSEEEVEEALGRISNDLWYHMGSWLMADLLAGAGPDAPPVWFYTVSEPGYTHHGDDTPIFNGSRWPKEGPPTSPAPATGMGFLANFARCGDPNGAGLPTWEPHSAAAPRFMELGPEVGMRARSKAEHERYALVSEHIRSLVAVGEEKVERPAGAVTGAVTAAAGGGDMV